jgi:hypothetical protein
MLTRVSQLREDACAVGAVGGDLALVLVGQQRQGRGQIEDGLWQGNLQQEAHGTQTQGQHRQRRPRGVGRADLSLVALGGPPLSPPGRPRQGEARYGP